MERKRRSDVGEGRCRDEDLFRPVNKTLDSRLLIAARQGNLQAMEADFRLLEASRGRRFAVRCFSVHDNQFGKTALHESVQNGHDDCVRYLVEEVGVEVNCLKRGDWTPLMLACAGGYEAIIRCLLAAGAETGYRNKDGMTAFHLACRNGNAQVVNLLLQQNERLVLSTSNNGRTPLHTAALFGHEAIVRALLATERQPIDPRDSCGASPLMDALRSGSVTVAKCLLEAKADISSEDGLKRKLIHVSAEAGQIPSLKLLLELGGAINERCASNGMTAVHFAAKGGRLDALKFLFNHGADMNTRDDFGRTALHVAVINRSFDCWAFLKEVCDADIVDVYGKTAENYSRST